MTAYGIIKKKRDGNELSSKEIEYLIHGYTSGSIEDYAMSAFAMSVFFRGMTSRETTDLTLSMMHSGETADLSLLGDKTVDKHSTGGVGDKTTLIVAPIVASLGGIVAKMSGRALGHTGGTVDKLEAIPGYITQMTPDDFKAQAAKIGVCVVGQTGNFAPADKKLYALRSVTATVESLPLIASSIMSKKLAAGARSIVLDVKSGSGAFMKDYSSASALAKAMVDIGKGCGRNISALITDMDSPLGNAVGNSLEVKEAIAVLKAEEKGRLRTVCVALASKMLTLCNGWSNAESKARVEKALDSGAAYEKFCEWISTQGGDLSKLPTAPVIREVVSRTSGFIKHINSEEAGNASLLLGAGRLKKDDSVDFSAGIVICKTVGDYVEKGEPLAYLHTSDDAKIPEAEARFLAAVAIGKENEKENNIEKPLILGEM